MTDSFLCLILKLPSISPTSTSLLTDATSGAAGTTPNPTWTNKTTPTATPTLIKLQQLLPPEAGEQIECPDGIVCDVHHIFKFRCVVYDCPKGFYPCQIKKCAFDIIHNVYCKVLVCYRKPSPKLSTTTQVWVALGTVIFFAACMYLLSRYQDVIRLGVLPPDYNPSIEAAVEALNFFKAEDILTPPAIQVDLAIDALQYFADEEIFAAEIDIFSRSPELNFDRLELNLMEERRPEMHELRRLVFVPASRRTESQ